MVIVIIVMIATIDIIFTGLVEHKHTNQVLAYVKEYRIVTLAELSLRMVWSSTNTPIKY